MITSTMNTSITVIDPSSRISFGVIKGEDFSGSMQNQLNQQSPTPISASATTPHKKKRGLPGTLNADADAEVIALSPKSLLATNRFICEVCHKGFQREQNLQLHRRGHNLPWKLKQKSTKEVKKKVYVCPETTCVHHEPSRALGDLTGIKKHFCRKHGEKKWKCEKCSKKYAVQSDWKAHSKTCGTREYRCDCGTIFSRRDSFITHRAFCDALSQETALHLPGGLQLDNHHHQSSDILKFQGSSSQFNHLFPSSDSSIRSLPNFLPSGINQDFNEGSQTIGDYQLGLSHIHSQINAANSSSYRNHPESNPFNMGFLSNTTITDRKQTDNSQITASGFNSIWDRFNSSINILNDHLISESVSSLYSSQRQTSATLPQMSATALLQKAAQVGATATGNNHHSPLGGFGGSTANSMNGLNRQDRRSSSSSSSFPNSNSTSFHQTNLQDQLKGNFSSCQETQLHDIMNSIDNGNAANDFSRIIRTRGHEFGSDQLANFGAKYFGSIDNHKVSLCSDSQNQDDDRHHQISGSALSLEAGDRLTRDFLGVGRRYRGGIFGQGDRHHEQNLNFAAVDPEMKPYLEGFFQ